MKPGMQNVLLSWPVLIICLSVLVLAPDALAADSGGDWRPTYDLVMRWVNFIILAAVIVKFGRRPLMDYLTGRKEEVAYELRRLEEEKGALLENVGEMRRKIEDSESRYEQIKERIIAQGNNRKQAIIDEAQRESRILMETAKNHIENRLRTAKRTIRAEIIDMAVSRAMQELPAMVTAEDNSKLVEKLIEQAASG